MKDSTQKLFLFGGCYSNLQATKKIKEIADELGFCPEQIICTGDIVGYCAQPEETVQLIKDWGIQVIAGNVEVQLRNGEIDCGCNFDEGSRCDLLSRQWFPFAQENLSTDSINWMHLLSNSIEFHHKQRTYHVLHGGTDDISEFIFESTPEWRKLEIFEQTKADVIIAGHSGLPFQQIIKNQKGEKKWWINPGVIGMPANDGTPRCWFGVLDLETNSFELKELNYNFQLASDLMRKNNLPLAYADTLVSGIWDNCDILPEKESLKQGFQL